ncbi:MAG: sulfur carrier protein ThiS [Planctomycetota bacterium]
MMMRIFINGALKEIAGGLTVKKLLDTLKLNSEAIAVELNLEVVSKKEYDAKYLKEGDKIEIISFVGGG